MTLNTFQLSIALFFVFLLFWLWTRRLRQDTGLPTGRVIYTDTGTWYANAKVFYDNEHRLMGKPDYLVERPGGVIIPVELKSGRAPEEPYEGHVLQLAAYCLLVEKNYGLRPAYGILQYADRAFAIDYTPDLEADLLDLVDEIREGMLYEELDRDHVDWNRCAQCSLNRYCDQRLG